ncbi:FAD-dependent oxidoreductase [Serinicoccus kebangsaanensis]|uniref:FAD-dependent oxidoreductase n=1 Tax=Serinicoccus kebangsaanensis TaxID=2602069 RepID=UPI00124CE966|nr:FAD-dependent oxidoreductase [Serinicoccus kebangsaanensis]
MDTVWDVVVIGAGAAGLACSVAAAEAGASVLLLERGQALGGTTVYSVGSMTAAGTSLQRRAGIEDDTEQLIEDMWDYPDAGLSGDAPDLRRLYAEESGPTLEWLVRHGVQFTLPNIEPPHRVARMHNVVPSSRSYITRLAEAARAAGVHVALATEVRELVLEDGTVSGAVVAGPEGESTVLARRGVVLATGDFSGNSVMRQEHLSEAAAAALPINPEALGSGHQLAAQAGGELVAMDRLFGPQLRFGPPPRRGWLDRLPTWRWLCAIEGAVVRHVPASALRPVVKSLLVTHMSPTDALFRSGAVLVDRDGVRFGQEQDPAKELSARPGSTGYIIMDESVATTFDSEPNFISTAPGIAFAYFTDYRRGRPDLVTRADGVEELATRLGLDASALSASVGTSELRAPFVAMGPVHSMLTVTEGAVRVDGSLQVQRPDGQPVRGLFAIGAVGQGGMLLKGHGHHIGWAMTSGRVLGVRLAARPLDASSTRIQDEEEAA